MGCDDYYDPGRERENRNWRVNNKLIDESNCRRAGDDAVSCLECGAMIWTGNLWKTDHIPFVLLHARWHKGRE